MQNGYSRLAARTRILYIDKGFIVCNKPSGLVCQSDVKFKHRQSRVPAEYDIGALCEEIKKTQNFPPESRLFPVHRLDKYTTGALILARSINLSREISRQFASRQVGKVYLAVLRARMEVGAKGTVDVGLMMDENGRMKVVPRDMDMTTLDSSKMKKSVSHWEVINSSKLAPLSLVRFHIETGIKHQIRLHGASVLNAPVLGDTLYSPPPPEQRPFSFSDLYLHASALTFTRYFTRRHQLTIHAPLPPHFQSLLTKHKMVSSLSHLEQFGGLLVDGVQVDEIPEVQGRWVGPTRKE